MPLRTDNHHAIGQATALAYGHIIQTTTNGRGRMYRCTGNDEHKSGSCRNQYERANAIGQGITTASGPSHTHRHIARILPLYRRTTTQHQQVLGETHRTFITTTTTISRSTAIHIGHLPLLLPIPRDTRLTGVRGIGA